MAEQDVVYSWIKIQTADGATYPFAIDPESYVKRDIIDFAPRSGGGDVAYSNLDLYQLVTQDSWHHGVGFVQFRDKFGYRVTSDGVDTRHVGMATMFTKYSSDYNYADNSFINAVDFAGATYFSMGGGGVWKRTTGGTWSRVYNGTVGKIMTNGSYLIVAKPSGRLQTSSDGTSWADAGVSGNPPNNFYHLDIHNGFMWGSESGAAATRTLTGVNATAGVIGANAMVNITGTNTKFLSELRPEDYIKIGSTLAGRVKGFLSDTIISILVGVGATLSGGEAIVKTTSGQDYDCVHFWSAADSSDAEGGGVGDVGAIVVGAGSPVIKGIASFNNMLHIARPDGVWAVDDTVVPPLARRVLSFPDEQNASNFNIFLPWRGRLYFNIKNTLYAYNGSSLANVTPPTYDLNYPPAAFGNFIGATYRGPFLYVLSSDNQATPRYYLLAFDGTGWFLLLDLGTTTPTNIGYSALTDNMFIGISGGEEIRVPFQSKSELPYASFEYFALVNSSSTDTVSLVLPNSTTVTTHANINPGSLDGYIHFLSGGNNYYYWMRDDGAGTVNMYALGFNDTPPIPFTDGSGLINYDTGVMTSSYFHAGFGTLIGSLFNYEYITGTVADHYLYLSEIDFGFRRVIKSFAEVDLEVYNVTAARYVAVDYSADGGAWQRLNQVSSSGITKMNMNPTVEAYKLDVRLNFQTDDTAQSPVLRNAAVKAMIRPDTLFGHQVVIVGGNEIRMLDNRFNPGSSEQQKQWIEAVRNSKAPITFVDPFGVSHQGYISTAQFLDVRRRPGESQSSWQCRVNIVEVR